MTIKITNLTLLTLLCTPLSYAQVQNGDFEQWVGNTPTDWTTIDSGISITPSSTQISNGGLSAQVTVNTTIQSNTDLLQTLSVEQGKSYPFSVSIYHTEGHLQARLIVDGYQGYSEPQKTNQWQTLTHNYIATSTKDIQVGLRFYDMTGFNGSELIYIDNFQPSSSTMTPPTNICGDHDLTLNLTTDQYAAETSWEIINSQSKVVYSGNGYSNSTTYNQNICLADGEYTFTINDSHGDGICCSFGNGSYSLVNGQQTLSSGGQFQYKQSNNFSLSEPSLSPSTDYYQAAAGKTGFELKSALYNIINNHNSRGYSAIWTLVKDADLDNYYENDGSILDVYSEKPASNDDVNFTKVSDQCGQYKQEGDCYNREHSFPKSWFGGAVEPMYSDGHHLFATDGFVNSKRSNWPFGEVGNSTYVSSNGSKLGTASSSLGYNGTVFEPIDEFKGDFARAYFYMATRYENIVSNWQENSINSDAVLDGSSTTVFEPWLLTMLKRWHQEDPVSAKEHERNEAIYQFQGNRNPYIDHPEYVNQIWGN